MSSWLLLARWRCYLLLLLLWWWWWWRLFVLSSLSLSLSLLSLPSLSLLLSSCCYGVMLVVVAVAAAAAVVVVVDVVAAAVVSPTFGRHISNVAPSPFVSRCLYAKGSLPCLSHIAQGFVSAQIIGFSAAKPGAASRPSLVGGLNAARWLQNTLTSALKKTELSFTLTTPPLFQIRN